MSIACGSDRPARWSSSTTSSKDAESDAPAEVMSPSSARSPRTSERRFPWRAAIQFRFPRTVLISPLWASIRNGWASGQEGKVLVEKRECTRAICEAKRSSFRSGKNRRSWEVVSIPLYEIVRLDSEAKYTPRALSERLRTRKARLSRSSPRAPSGAFRKSWRNTGMQSRAMRPIIESSNGTSRQPRTSRPSSATIASIRPTARARSAPSLGRKAMPAAYPPGSGRSRPVTAAKNSCGSWVRMPAPSPEFSSAPTAPRWSRLASAVRPASTMSRPARPRSVATKATPQASCSKRGS